ncbi:unnamed protein product [Amoebophrya sp. A120]|nr:unnamed protein product [Amoebophrya sp. A120]|eukprot:GSA120T00017914001.1
MVLCLLTAAWIGNCERPPQSLRLGVIMSIFLQTHNPSLPKTQTRTAWLTMNVRREKSEVGKGYAPLQETIGVTNRYFRGRNVIICTTQVGFGRTLVQHRDVAGRRIPKQSRRSCRSFQAALCGFRKIGFVSNSRRQMQSRECPGMQRRAERVSCGPQKEINPCVEWMRVVQVKERREHLRFSAMAEHTQRERARHAHSSRKRSHLYELPHRRYAPDTGTKTLRSALLKRRTRWGFRVVQYFKSCGTCERRKCVPWSFSSD